MKDSEDSLSQVNGGRKYVERVHDLDKVVDQHIKIYEEILGE